MYTPAFFAVRYIIFFFFLFPVSVPQRIPVSNEKSTLSPPGGANNSLQFLYFRDEIRLDCSQAVYFCPEPLVLQYYR